MGASQSALSIQNPSQTGPRTQGTGRFDANGIAGATSAIATGEENAAIEQLQLSNKE
jgi:hypothetical protein